MKRLVFTMVVLTTMIVNAGAMSYEQAQREALFLTDKMAYELNLTDAQYDAAYEINLDYLMGVASVDDVYGDYWTRRNLDMSYILLSWQWDLFTAATYFYRPLYWEAGYWHFGIYARYPRRTFFYFDKPRCYLSYRGGHSWAMNGGKSYYNGRQNQIRGNGTTNHSGMRDKWNSGSIGHNSAGGSSYSRQNSGSGVSRSGQSGSTNRSSSGSSYNRNSSGSRYNGSGSSTRVTVGNKSNSSYRGRQSSGSVRQNSSSSSSRSSGNVRSGSSRSSVKSSGSGIKSSGGSGMKSSGGAKGHMSSAPKSGGGQGFHSSKV